MDVANPVIRPEHFNSMMHDGLPVQAKPVTPRELRAFGLVAQNHMKMADSMEELRRGVPNIIIAQCKLDVKFIQNKFRVQSFKRKSQYVMSLGVYNQLKYDPYRHKTVLVPGTMKFKNIFKAYRGQNLDGKTLLVWRTGGIGDLLFIQPNLRYLKETYPDCHIKFSCGPQYSSLVDNWDCIDELLDLPFHVSHLLHSDYHVTFEGVIERCKEAHTNNAYVLFSKWLGLDLPTNLLYPIIEPKPKKVKEVEGILKQWGTSPKNFIVLQIRASSPVRTPSPFFWKRIIDQLNTLGYTTVITDSPHRAPYVEEFIKTLSHPRSCMNFSVFSKSLDLTIALVSLAKMAISIDSAISHISAGLNIPYYGIYGPFPGEIRLSTYKNSKWINAPSPCAPCFLHGHRPCPHANPDGSSSCYDKINIDALLQDAISMLGSHENRRNVNDKDYGNNTK